MDHETLLGTSLAEHLADQYPEAAFDESPVELDEGYNPGPEPIPEWRLTIQDHPDEEPLLPADFIVAVDDKSD